LTIRRREATAEPSELRVILGLHWKWLKMATSVALEKGTSDDCALTLSERIDVFLRANRAWIVVFCCCYATFRILIFAAAFPLCNQVDEQDHYEMIYRYSHGYAPESTLPRADPELARVFTLFGSPEFFHSKEELQAFHRNVPIAALPPALKEYHYKKVLAFWENKSDMEAQSPPVYYALGSVWYRVGAALGAKDWVLAYWTRFLSAIVYGLFVFISFLFVEELYPARNFLCVAVPMFLAVFPQDVFFGMNRDVLSPLLGALAMLVLFQALREESGGYGNLIGGGVLVGLGFLTEVSNVLFFGLLAVVLYSRYRRARARSDSKRELKAIAASGAIAMLFPILWMAHNVMVTGDMTAAWAKTGYLGWTLKPWREIWQHPIFSASGFQYFFNVLTETFWRGEIWWRGDKMRWSVADGLYRISSILFLVIFAVKLFKKGRSERLQRINGYLSLYLILAAYLFMGAISLPYDFHDCVNPSRAHPFFVSGRIIIGVLLPFAIMYLSGFETLFEPIRRYVHPLIPFAVFAIFVTVTELIVRGDIFHSAFNFFSLLRM
jgi:hypothetical protein